MLTKKCLFLSVAVLLFTSAIFALDGEEVGVKVNLLYEEQNFAMFYMEKSDYLVADSTYRLAVDGVEVGEVRIKKVEQFFTVAEVISLTDWSIEGRAGVLKPSAPAGYAGPRHRVRVGPDAPRYEGLYREDAEEAWAVSDVDYLEGAVEAKTGPSYGKKAPSKGKSRYGEENTEERWESAGADYGERGRGEEAEPSYAAGSRTGSPAPPATAPGARKKRKQKLQPALAGTSFYGPLGLIFLPTTDFVGYKRARLTIARVQREMSGDGAALFGVNYEGKADNTIYAVTYGLVPGVEVSYAMDVIHVREWSSAPDKLGFASGQAYASDRENVRTFSVKAVYPKLRWNGTSVGAAYILEKGGGGDARYYRFLLTLFDDKDISLHGMYGVRDYESAKNFEYGYAAKVRLNGDIVLFGEHYEPDTSDEYFDDYKIKSYGVQFRLSGNLSGRFTYIDIESEVLEDFLDTRIVSYDLAYDF
ncbi:MAG: hypothetical protein ABIG11_05775 [bacterium]